MASTISRAGIHGTLTDAEIDVLASSKRQAALSTNPAILSLTNDLVPNAPFLPAYGSAESMFRRSGGYTLTVAARTLLQLDLHVDQTPLLALTCSGSRYLLGKQCSLSLPLSTCLHLWCQGLFRAARAL